MSLEDKQEKDVMEVVYCRGFKKLLNLKSCNSSCEHYGDILKESIYEGPKGNRKLIGYKRSVVCKFPRIEAILTICEV